MQRSAARRRALSSKCAASFKKLPVFLRARPNGLRALRDICTLSVQKEMSAHVLAIPAPIVVGVFPRVNGVVGMLSGATVTGFILA